MDEQPLSKMIPTSTLRCGDKAYFYRRDVLGLGYALNWDRGGIIVSDICKYSTITKPGLVNA